jgi:geranylgeranyl diphosphate synthase type I
VFEDEESLSPMLVDVEVPASIAQASDLATRELLDFLNAEIGRWGRIDHEFVQPIEELRRFIISGGKRLRPAFCYWTAVGLGACPSDPQLLRALMGLEFLHSFALIHDDLMDASDTRRGEPSLHRVFERAHSAAELRGSRARYGISGAILVGDLAFAYADMMFADTNRRARLIFQELKVEVNLGQYLDFVGGYRDVEIPRAERIALFKSGKYTVERPMHIGAAIAGRYSLAEEAISSFAVPLGMAFQLRDDVLGAFGEAEVTRKPVGDDLREGKPTLLVGLTRSLLARDEREVFDQLFGREDVSSLEIATMQELIRSSGALGALERKIDQLFLASMEALERLDLDPAARAALGEMAGFVVDRRC